MTKYLSIAALALLVGCSGGYKAAGRSNAPARQSTNQTAGQTTPMRAIKIASGPISSACMASKRKARSRQLCGCIQAVANQNLSSSDQRLAASFYSDPQKAQDIRQSDRSSHETFWLKYKDYGQTAAASCGKSA